MDREKQAWEELERSSVTRPARWVLGAVFLLVVAVVFVAVVGKPYGPRDAVRAFWFRDRPAEPADGAWASVRAWNEEALADIARFESQIEDESLLRATLPGWQWFYAEVLGASGTGRVLFGRDDWLFLRDNVELALGRADAGNRTAADRAVRELAAVLSARGARLLLVPVPPKPGIHPSRFSSRFGPRAVLPVDPGRASLYRSWESIPGVSVAPVRAILAGRAREGGDAFLARDTHWTPEAMEEVAAAIAAGARAAGGTDASPAEFSAEGTRTVRGEGDLVRMLELPGAPEFPRQAVEVPRFAPPEGAGGKGRAGTGPPDLFLLGDSFADVFSDEDLGWGAGSGLVDVLSQGYGLETKAFVNHGDPVLGPRQRLRRALASSDPVPPVVVWQFAERFLDEGDWRPVFREGGPGNVD